MTRYIDLVQIGVGGVGSEVVRLALAHLDRWKQRGLCVRYAGLIDTSGGVVCKEGLSEARVREALEAKASDTPLAGIEGGVRARPEEIVAHLSDLPNAVLVDCAAGDSTYAAGLSAARLGWNLVLSNKAPLAVDQDRYDSLAVEAEGRLRYEAIVGAGLPVISTLRSLLDTGDSIEEITGCLSGTLGFITSRMMEGATYSEAVADARRLGYTEPDPRDDLCGLDVARKALILARTCGGRMDLADVRVEPLMPNVSPDLSVDEFMAQLSQADAEMSERAASAKAAGKVLKYTATIRMDGDVSVGLRPFESGSRIGSLTGPDNIVVFRSRVYHDHPVVVIGPGAGTVNTAMGVLSDILQAVRV